MAEGGFDVTLVTPERVLVSGRATEVVLRTAEGDLTFLDGHTPLVGSVQPGVVRVGREEGDDEHFAVHGGFVQVERVAHGEEEPAFGGGGAGTRVTMLAGVAEPTEEIDVERARRALEAAEARISELGGATVPEGEAADPALVAAQAARRRAEVRLEATGAGAASG